MLLFCNKLFSESPSTTLKRHVSVSKSLECNSRKGLRTARWGTSRSFWILMGIGSRQARYIITTRLSTFTMFCLLDRPGKVQSLIHTSLSRERKPHVIVAILRSNILNHGDNSTCTILRWNWPLMSIAVSTSVVTAIEILYYLGVPVKKNSPSSRYGVSQLRGV